MMNQAVFNRLESICDKYLEVLTKHKKIQLPESGAFGDDIIDSDPEPYLNADHESEPELSTIPVTCIDEWDSYENNSHELLNLNSKIQSSKKATRQSKEPQHSEIALPNRKKKGKYFSKLRLRRSINPPFKKVNKSNKLRVSKGCKKYDTTNQHRTTTKLLKCKSLNTSKPITKKKLSDYVSFENAIEQYWKPVEEVIFLDCKKLCIYKFSASDLKKGLVKLSDDLLQINGGCMEEHIRNCTKAAQISEQHSIKKNHQDQVKKDQFELFGSKVDVFEPSKSRASITNGIEPNLNFKKTLIQLGKGNIGQTPQKKDLQICDGSIVHSTREQERRSNSNYEEHEKDNEILNSGIEHEISDENNGHENNSKIKNVSVVLHKISVAEQSSEISQEKDNLLRSDKSSPSSKEMKKLRISNTVLLDKVNTASVENDVASNQKDRSMIQQLPRPLRDKSNNTKEKPSLWNILNTSKSIDSSLSESEASAHKNMNHKKAKNLHAEKNNEEEICRMSQEETNLQSNKSIVITHADNQREKKGSPSKFDEESDNDTQDELFISKEQYDEISKSYRRKKLKNKNAITIECKKNINERDQENSNYNSVDDNPKVKNGDRNGNVENHIVNNLKQSSVIRQLSPLKYKLNNREEKLSLLSNNKSDFNVSESRSSRRKNVNAQKVKELHKVNNNAEQLSQISQDEMNSQIDNDKHVLLGKVNKVSVASNLKDRSAVQQLPQPLRDKSNNAKEKLSLWTILSTSKSMDNLSESEASTHRNANLKKTKNLREENNNGEEICGMSHEEMNSQVHNDESVSNKSKVITFADNQREKRGSPSKLDEEYDNDTQDELFISKEENDENSNLSSRRKKLKNKNSITIECKKKINQRDQGNSKYNSVDDNPKLENGDRNGNVENHIVNNLNQSSVIRQLSPLKYKLNNREEKLLLLSPNKSDLSVLESRSSRRKCANAQKVKELHEVNNNAEQICQMPREEMNLQIYNDEHILNNRKIVITYEQNQGERYEVSKSPNRRKKLRNDDSPRNKYRNKINKKEGRSSSHNFEDENPKLTNRDNGNVENHVRNLNETVFEQPSYHLRNKSYKEDKLPLQPDFDNSKSMDLNVTKSRVSTCKEKDDNLKLKSRDKNWKAPSHVRNLNETVFEQPSYHLRNKSYKEDKLSFKPDLGNSKSMDLNLTESRVSTRKKTNARKINNLNEVNSNAEPLSQEMNLQIYNNDLVLNNRSIVITCEPNQGEKRGSAEKFYNECDKENQDELLNSENRGDEVSESSEKRKLKNEDPLKNKKKINRRERRLSNDYNWEDDNLSFIDMRNEDDRGSIMNESLTITTNPKIRNIDQNRYVDNSFANKLKESYVFEQPSLPLKNKSSNEQKLSLWSVLSNSRSVDLSVLSNFNHSIRQNPLKQTLKTKYW